MTRDGGIAGLGSAYLASRTAYAYDAEERAVVTLTSRGRVLAIPLDETRAHPAGPALRARWVDQLNLDDGRRPLSDTASDDVPESIRIPGDPPHDLEIVSSVDRTTLTVVDRATGAVRHTYQAADAVRAVVVSPRGRVVAVTANETFGELVVVTADGISGCPVGDTNFLGF